MSVPHLRRQTSRMALRASVVPTPRKGREEWGTLFVLADAKVKINFKGDGEECPFHTGNVKGSGRGRPLYTRMLG